MNEIASYPQTFEEAIDIVAKEKHLKVLRYEYWGVPIRTLQWVNNSVLNSVQFDSQDNNIGVTFKTEKTGGIYSLFRWCHNNIPLFPCLIKSTSLEKSLLPKQCSTEEYAKTIEALVENNV